jgi:hypothetical protein
MVSSAQLRAARAYLRWTMDRAAAAAGIHRRTLIRLECEAGYAERRPASLGRLVAAYRGQRIMLEGDGLAVATGSAEAITSPTPPNGAN